MTLDNRAQRTAILLMLLVLAVVVLEYLVALGTYPLLGTTEGRYAEMARKMVASGDYLVPMFNDTAPFWGKPPLSMWAGAAAMNLFGMNGFAARLPSLLATLATLALLYHFARAYTDKATAVLAVLIMASCDAAYTAFGKVQTDSILMLAVTTTIVGLYFGIERGDKRYIALGCLGILAGLMCKGPVALVYAGLPIFVWALVQRQLVNALASPALWVGGITAVALAGVWFYSAEQRFPGFLEYYFVGEHWQRYLETDWQGDLYGAGRGEAYGAILVFTLRGTLPWSLVGLVLLIVWAVRRSAFSPQALPRSPMVLTLAWAFLPLLFFTFAANARGTYALPALPALSLLLALCFAPLAFRNRVSLVVFLLLALVVPNVKSMRNFQGEAGYQTGRNQLPLAEMYLDAGAELSRYYAGSRRQTAEFYLQEPINNVRALEELPQQGPYLLGAHADRRPFDVPSNCALVSTKNVYEMYRCE